jgi:hypothetical protein
MTAKRATIAIAAFALSSTAAGAADLYVKAAPMQAPQTASGYVEMYTGWDRTRFSDEGSESLGPDSLSGWALGGAGRGNYWFQPNMSVQLDAQGEGTSYKVPFSGGGRASGNSYLVGAHVTWRDPQNYAWGIFGAGGDVTGVRHGLIGGEAQIYWNQFTLYGQVGYDTTIGDVFVAGNSADAVFGRITGRYFFTPNLMLEGTGLYANGTFDNASGPSQDFDTWLWQAKLEWRPGAAPFSVFAKYQGSETKFDSFQGNGGKVTDNRIVAGVRLYLGEGTLLSNDRKGATLDIIDVLGATLVGPGFVGVSDAPPP